MSGYNLPDNVSANDPDAPWNQVDEVDEVDQEPEAEAACTDENCGWTGTYDQAVLEGGGGMDSYYTCPVCGERVADIVDVEFSIED